MLRFFPLPEEDTTRPVCAVFADLVGSTQLAHRLGAAQYAALMTEAVQLMILSFEAGGGAVMQHQGDAVVALWPQEGASLALNASLGIHSHLSNLELARLLRSPLRLRVGLSAGAVVVGYISGVPNAYGLPLNLSRRLCSAAQPGQTLVCPRARALLPTQALSIYPLAPLRDFEQLTTAYLAWPEPQMQMKIS